MDEFLGIVMVDQPTTSFSATYWNFIQTLGWVYLCDREIVEETGRAERSPTRIFLITAAEDRTGRYASLGEAEVEFYEALRSGALTALGVFNNAGDVQEIPANFWLHGKIYEEPEHATSQILGSWQKSWYGLRFPRSQVLRRWPDPAPVLSASQLNPAALLSFEQVAGRWLGEVTKSGISCESLSVDLIRLAETGVFAMRPEKGEPYGPHFDSRNGKHIHTFDQFERPASPHWIVGFSTSGPTGSEWKQRLIAARNLSVDLSALARWLATEEGQTWMRVRGLRHPSFAAKPESKKQTGTISDKTRCRNWLVEKMKAGNPTGPKSEVFAEAKSIFRISERSFREVWSQAIEIRGNEAWSKAGRRRRNS